jgi:hypothetical protein
MTLKAGETREGFLFFHLEGTVADWASARIAAP